MTDRPGLRDLELLHRRLEELRHHIGSSVDYLDRGRPSPEQEKAAWATITESTEKASSVCQELEHLVSVVRENNPALLDRWVDVHQAILREAKTEVECEASDYLDEGFTKTALFVINQEVEQWEEVRAGGRTYVIGNWYFLRNRRSIERKLFGF